MATTYRRPDHSRTGDFGPVVHHGWERFELAGSENLPPGEAAACQEWFDGEIRPHLAPEDVQAAWTMWRRAWRASWLHGLAVKAAEVRAAMGRG